MKNATKKLLKKLLNSALVLAAICAVTVFAAVSSHAAEDIIPVPDFPIIRAPYATDEIFAIDLAAIDALFPRELEMTYENGVISVKDFGAGIMKYNNGNIYTEMTLTDGYWTVEVGDRSNLSYEFFYVYSSDSVNTNQGRVWHITYLNDIRDPYIVLTDYDQNVDLTLAYDYEYIGNSYETDTHNYNDTYRNGVLTKHEVSPFAAGDLSNITYDADRNILYISFYFYDDTGWMYYFPEQGWSSSWANYNPVDAPAGYDEELDLDYYRSLAPAICMEHTWDEGVCSVCSYSCDHRDGILSDSGVCATCNVFVANAKVTLTNGTEQYFSLLEDALTYAADNTDCTVTLLADCTPTVKSWFEVKSGTFTLDLNGFDVLTMSNTSIITGNTYLTIVDDSEQPGALAQMINMNPGSNITINGGIYSNIQTSNNTNLVFLGGTVTEKILLSSSTSKATISGGQFAIICSYSDDGVLGALKEGYFFFGADGKLITAEKLAAGNTVENVTVGTHTDADHIGGLANCTFGAICDICDQEYTAPTPDVHVWDEGTVTTQPNCTEPGVKTFICEHDNTHTKTEAVDPVADNHKWDEGTVTTDPNCTEPGVKTFICEHNSEHTRTETVDPVAENHKWDEGTVTTEPNCTIPGTKTFTCEHNSAHTRTEPVDIVADAHKWDSGSVTTEPTCTDKGEKTFVCEHNVQHTKTEEIDSLGGHKYDNACDPDCNECGVTRTPAAHFSENADGKCDECGESFKLSGGEIAGIATGSTAVVGLGGFSLFWFVIKKKKFSDLFGK